MYFSYLKAHVNLVLKNVHTKVYNMLKCTMLHVPKVDHVVYLGPILQKVDFGVQQRDQFCNNLKPIHPLNASV